MTHRIIPNLKVRDASAGHDFYAETASGGTTLQLGPLTHGAAWVALEAFLGRPLPPAPAE